jgi:hypothetical protein
MMRAPALTLALLLLAACQIALPGRDRTPEAASPITVGAVAVSTLAPVQAASSAAGAAEVASAPPPATAARPAPQPVASAAPASAPASASAAAPSPAQSPAMPAAALDTEVEAVPLSPEELACRAGGGVWSRMGQTVARVCVRPTPDARKSCTRQTDCKTECLARSRTCAPVTPLVGCHPVLQADGREVTLCLE